MKLIIQIPCHNEAATLPETIAALPRAVSGIHSIEVLIIDNGSTDGSVEFLRQNFPTVHVIALPKNLGFGGGSNTGFREAKNDIVVLLNSDMRVAEDFLQPLLDAFHDETVFAAACQIFFSDPNKVREETGLEVDVGPVVEVFERIQRESSGRIAYHFVIVDYLCAVRSGDAAHGSDALDLCWAPVADLLPYSLTEKASAVIKKACEIATRNTPAGPAAR